VAGHPQYTYAPLLISRAALFLTLGALGSTSYSKSSRTSGRHIGKQLPGQADGRTPEHAGTGSFTAAANYIYDVAPKYRTAIGVMASPQYIRQSG
jgi:hypothetical protein